MLHQGIVIWLDVMRDQLLARLKTDMTERPLLQGPEPEAAVDALLAKRQRFYSEADLTVVIQDESPEMVADGIMQLLPELLVDPTKRRE